MKRSILLLLSLVVIWGFVLRVWDLGTSSLWIDEIYTINGAQAIVVHGYPLLDSGALYTNNFVSTFISAGIMAFFGFDPFNPWPIRLPSVICGTLAIVALFVATKRLFKKESIALVASFLMAFSYWEIAWSRQIRGYEICTFFLLLVCTYTYTYLQNKKSRDLVLASVFFSVALFSHWVALVFVIPFLVCVFMARKPEISFEKLKIIGIFSFVFLLVSICIARSIHPFGLGMNLMFAELLPWVFFILIGFFISLTHVEYRRVSIVLMSVALFSFSILILSTDIVYSRYLFPFMPIFFVYTAYAVVNIPKTLLSDREIFSRVFLFTLLVAVGFLICSFFPKSFYKLERDSPQPDFKTAFSIIKNRVKSGDFVISVYPVVQKVFLDDKGLWLPLPVGTKNNIRLKSGETHDFYVNAPSLGGLEKLVEMMKNKDGFIILDPSSKHILESFQEGIPFFDKAQLVYESGESSEDRLWVYQF